MIPLKFSLRIPAVCSIACLAVMPITGRAATLGDLFPSGAAACFAVQQDAKHLERNPRQRIAAVRLSSPADPSRAGDPADLLMLDLDVSLRGGAKRTKTVGVICLKQADETWRCNEHTCNGRAI